MIDERNELVTQIDNMIETDLDKYVRSIDYEIKNIEPKTFNHIILHYVKQGKGSCVNSDDGLYFHIMTDKITIRIYQSEGF